MAFRPAHRKFNWRPTLFSVAILAMLALAAGARFKPH
jgi:hypothetical protein